MLAWQVDHRLEKRNGKVCTLQNEVHPERVEIIAPVSCIKTTALKRSLTGSCAKDTHDIRHRPA